MKNLILLFFGLSIVLLGCKKSKVPNADFSYSTVGEAPTTVKFTNNSEDASSYQWDFGDGEISDSISPTHIFNYPGDYNVFLSAYNSEGVGECTKNIIVKGKAYLIFNGSEYDLYSVTSLENPNTIYKEHGFISINERSSITSTNLDKVYISFKNKAGDAFMVSAPYTIVENQTSLLGIYEFTSLSAIGGKKSQRTLTLKDVMQLKTN